MPWGRRRATWRRCRRTRGTRGKAKAHSNLGVLRGDRGDDLGAEKRYLAAVQADLGYADSGQSQPGARQGRVRRALRGHKKWDAAEPAD